MSLDTRRRLWLVVNLVTAIAILAGVAGYFTKSLRDARFDLSRLQVRVDLLVLAGVLYIAAHTCWALFWVRLLHHEGVKVSWYAGLRAYLISQFGKYLVKGWVVVMRIGMLRHDTHAHPIPVAVTAVYETLCSMAAGALIGLLLLPQLGVLPVEVTSRTSALLTMAALPVVLGVLNKLAARVVAKKRGTQARQFPAPSPFLLAQGLVHGACGHCLLGLSLGLTVMSVLPEAPGPAETYAADLGANAIAYVAGFLVVVAPGGLGAREFVLATALAPRFAAVAETQDAFALAIVTALLLRFVWTVAEVVVAVPLYFVQPPAAPIPHHTHHPELIDPTDPDYPKHAP
jgi:uncharacterized membrane protein YbhN (UPF0104 family)